VFDLKGDIRCIDDPRRARPNYADREYFRRAVAADDFTIGLYTRAKTDPARAVLPFALPLHGADGRLTGVVAIGLSIPYLNRIVGDWTIPPGGSLTLADREGNILARNPLPDRFVGTKIPDQFLTWVQAEAPGIDEVTSQDGTRRLLAYIPASLPPKGIYLSTGVAATTAYAPVRQAWWWNLAAVAGGLIGALVVSQLAGRYLIRSPADELISLATAWTRGRPASPDVVTGPREFAGIADALNRMGNDLESRARAAEDSETRLRLTIQTAPYPLLLQADDGTIQQANDSWWRQAGFDPSRADNPEPAQWPLAKDGSQTPFALPFDDRSHSREWRFTGGDGHERYWEFGVVPLGRLPNGRRLRLIAAADLTELKSAARRQQLLVDELNHRVKNTLAVVQAIGAQTAENTSDPDEFNRKFVERLQVLARTHDLLTARAWDRISLKAVLDDELSAMGPAEADIDSSGPDILLPPQIAVMLALVLHELCANALQHGCFSQAGGRLRVHWEMPERGGSEAASQTIRLEWEETCASVPANRGAPGFGTRLLSRAAAALGDGSLEIRPAGLFFSMRIDLPA
jgi:PAS domain S-box-containing protein